MFIEDLIVNLVKYNARLGKFEQNVVSNFHSQIFTGVGFTEKQSILAIAIVKKYEKQLALLLNKNIEFFIKNPTFKLPIRSLQKNKTIKVNKDKTISVSFPYNEQLLEKFRQVKPKLNYAHWDSDAKSWIFSLDERSILFLTDLIDYYGFECDDVFYDYYNQTKKISENFENFIPMMRKHQDNYILANSHENIKNFCYTDLITALFEARKLGISTWDDEIEHELESSNDHIVTKEFLKIQPNEKYTVNLEKFSLSSINTIIKNLLPCLIIIPGGSELDKIKLNFNLFKDLQLKNENISVMFRLSNENNKEFNEFIKENKLNNPITSNTSIVCLSNNIPKPVLESRIKFNSVLNYNFYSPHFKLRDYINTHHNVINIIEHSDQRRLNFGDL